MDDGSHGPLTPSGTDASGGPDRVPNGRAYVLTAFVLLVLIVAGLYLL